MQTEDKNGVQHDIQKAAGDEADHGVKRSALIPQHIVQNAAGTEEGAGKEDASPVLHRIRQNGLGAAEEPHERSDRQKTDDRQDETEEHGRKEPGGCRPVRRLLFPSSQLPADDGPGAVTEQEPEGLERGQDAEDDADRRAGAGAEPPHKVGVGQVVEHGDHHAEDGGDRQARNELRNGRVDQPVILRLFRFCPRAMYCFGHTGPSPLHIIFVL